MHSQKPLTRCFRRARQKAAAALHAAARWIDTAQVYERVDVYVGGVKMYEAESIEFEDFAGLNERTYDFKLALPTGETR